MSESVQVRIIASDGSSAVFQKIGASANQMGDQIERAGKDGATGLDQMGQSAQKNSTILGQLRDNATEVGAAIGAVVSVLSLLGSNSRNAELQVDAINRAYEDQADIILDLTEKVQDYSRFSNDAAREAALTFQTLTDNYGVSIQQLDELMLRSADVAQLRGRSLEEVSQMLQNAIRGEAEYAEAIGVTLNDTYLAMEYAARGLGNWNQVTDEAARAQFRFQVLMEQTAYAAGAAGDQVDNAGGRFRQFLNNVDDAGEAIGGFLGPIGEIAAEMAPIAVALPVVAGGLGRVAQTTVGARIGVVALAAATNPLVLGLTALAAVGGIVVESYRRQGEAIENYQESLVALGDTIEWLKLQGDDLLAEQAEDVKTNIDKIMTSFEELTAEGLAEQFSLPLIDAQQALNKIITEDFDAALDAVDDVNARIDEALRNPNVDQQAYLSWVEEMLDSIVTTAEGSNVDEVLNEILTRPLSDFRDSVDETSGWIDTLVDDTIEGAQRVAEEQKAFNEQVLNDTITLIEEVVARRNELFEVGTTLAGWDDALSGAALSGLGGESARLAENLTVAATAAENVFRVVVSNTNAIKSQADAALDWAEGLIAVRGEWSRLDELVRDGLITGESGEFDVDTQYAAAQDAYDSIVISTQQIKDNLDAVQAIQAPMIAEAQERTAAWTEELRNMSAEQQAVALGWYDATTAAQAMEAQMLITSAAAGEMGASGRDATQGFIEGAVAANPYLEAILTDLELVSRDHEGRLIVHFDGAEGARSDIDLLNESVRTLTDLLDDGEINGSIGIQVENQQDLDALENTMIELDGKSVTTTVNVQAGNAAVGDGTGGAQNWRDFLDIPETTDTTLGITVTGLEDIESAAAAIEGLEDTTITVTIDVDASALDTSLAQWGIGDGGGGGGAADFTAPSVRVEFTADTSEIDEWTPPTIEPIEVAITGNAGGQDGALTVLSNLQSGGKEGYSVEVAVTTAGGPEAVSALDGVTAAADAIPESESVLVTALAEGATVALQGVTAAAGDIPESESVSVSVFGADSAVSALNSVANAAANVPGSVSTTITTYRDTVYRTSGNPYAMALGGTVWGDDEPLRAANGRSVWVGEYGPELVSLPHGSQVTPHVASLSAAGGGGGGIRGEGVYVDLRGASFNGSNRDEIYDVFDKEIIPSLERSIRQLEAGMGV